MLTYSLVAHHDAPPISVLALDVEVYVNDVDEFMLTYIVKGADRLIVPAPSAGERVDGLWNTTCFECFVKPVETEDYYEFNFSPSGDWAAFGFDGYRRGKRDLKLHIPPMSDRDENGDPDTYVYDVCLNLSDVPGASLILGLATVIEEQGGRKSYWALTHPPGPPDFHHPDNFAAELGEPGWL